MASIRQPPKTFICCPTRAFRFLQLQERGSLQISRLTSSQLCCLGAPAAGNSMPSSEQENGGGPLLLPAGAKPVPPPPPFRFTAPRQLIDWRALHTLDLGSVVRDTDVDALEGVLDVVAFGDIEAEDCRTLTFANFTQLFRQVGNGKG